MVYELMIDNMRRCRIGAANTAGIDLLSPVISLLLLFSVRRYVLVRGSVVV